MYFAPFWPTAVAATAAAVVVVINIIAYNTIIVLKRLGKIYDIGLKYTSLV